MSVISQPAVFSNCTYDLDAVTFNDCPSNILSGAQINAIYLTAGTGFTDVTDSSEWTSRLALALTDNDAFVKLTVSGDYPAPDTETLEISNNRQIINTNVKSHVVNFTIDEISLSDTHPFLRRLEQGAKYRVFFTTLSGHMYTYGNEGIRDCQVVINHAGELDGDVNGIIRATGTLNWTAGQRTEFKFSPAIITNPIS